MNALVRSFLPTGQADKQDLLNCLKNKKEPVGMGVNLRISAKICVLLKFKKILGRLEG